MEFSIDNLNMLDPRLFHDHAISIIKCDYENHLVELPLLCSSNNNKVLLLRFFGVSDFSVSINEPWGEGVYVVDTRSTCKPHTSNETFEIVFQINSGDEIRITCINFIYEAMCQ